MKKLVVVSDAVSDPLYKQEFRSTIEGFLTDEINPSIFFVPCHSSTISSGFMLSQIITTEEYYGRPLNTVLYVNNGLHDGLQASSPLELIVLRMKSGMYIAGYNLGFNFSFIKNDIEEMYHYAYLDHKENPLRSDLSTRVCAHLMDDMQDELDLEEASTNMIEEVSHDYVGRVSRFGEILTTLRHEKVREQYHYGDLVPLKIGNLVKQVRFVSVETERISDEPIICPIAESKQYDSYMKIIGVHNECEVGTEIILT